MFLSVGRLTTFLDLACLSAFYFQTEKMPSPRMIRSHFCFDVMPKNMTKDAKVVVALRNPKDTIVSYYHHERLIKLFGFCGSFREYFDIFMDGLVAWGSYWEYNKEIWKRKDDPNVLLVFYEDMKRDLASCIHKVAKFLDKDITEEQVRLLENHLSFESMKNNPTVNLEFMREIGFNDIEGGRFMRKGEVGDWKNYFDDDMNQRIDAAVKEHFEDIGLTFTYEL